MNTPPRQTQSTMDGQPIPAVLSTPKQPIRNYGPPVIKKRRGENINLLTEPIPVSCVQNLGNMFERIALEQ